MNESTIERKVIGSVHAHRLVSPGDRIVVGVSGGADSVCLLHVLAMARQVLEIDLHVAHLDHQLRGVEAKADADYVSGVAQSLGIPCTVEQRDVAAYRQEAKCSVEEAARELRYSFLASVAGRVGASRIAVGHTRDDNVETILMHIVRGTGIDGLCGLAPCCPLPGVRQCLPGTVVQGDLRVVRPLLEVSRREAVDYCEEHGLGPRIDSSNLSPEFLRNRLRLDLLPLLRQYNPSIDQALLRLAGLAGEDMSFIQQQVADLWDQVARHEENAVRLDREEAAKLPAALQRRLLRAAVVHLIGDSRDIEASHVEAARSLLDKPVSKRVSLPRGIVCRGEYDHLVVERMPESADSAEPCAYGASCPLPQIEGEAIFTLPGETVLPGWRITASIVGEPLDCAPAQDSMSKISHRLPERLVAEFDLKKVGRKVFVRQRRAGDRFRPLGMDTSKKLQDFMVDARIPRAWRDRVPIVCSADQIIWVVGWRVDDRVKVTDASTDILRLEFSIRQ